MPVHRGADVKPASKAPTQRPRYTAVGQKHAWDTAHELAFVRGLGTSAFRPRTAPTPVAPRSLLLERYRASMARRHSWGNVNVVKIRAEVERLLAQETA